MKGGKLGREKRLWEVVVGKEKRAANWQANC